MSGQFHTPAGRIRSIKKSSDLIGNWTRDLPACRIVPEPTTLPREVLMVLTTRSTIFWNVILCSLFEVYKCSGKTYCLHCHSACCLPGLFFNPHDGVMVNFYQTTQRHISEDMILLMSTLYSTEVGTCRTCFSIKNLCILPTYCIWVLYDSHNKQWLKG
jgi:hypothetical protein